MKLQCTHDKLKYLLYSFSAINICFLVLSNQLDALKDQSQLLDKDKHRAMNKKQNDPEFRRFVIATRSECFLNVYVAVNFYFQLIFVFTCN